MAGPIISNMGLFWKKASVDWQKGQLLGTKMHAKRKGEVDFADQVGVYALYAADYTLVYVGQAGSSENGCLGKRLKEHTRNHLAGRWDMFSWFGLIRVTKKGLGKKFASKPWVTWERLIRVLEGVLIEIAEPPQNSQGGRLAEVDQYLQAPWVDPKQDISGLVKAISDIRRELPARPPKPTNASTKNAPKEHSIPTKKALAGPRQSEVNAAILVLYEARRPMSMTDIITTILDRKLWSPGAGRKSSFTMYHSFNHDKYSRFSKTPEGLWELTEAGRAAAPAIKKAFKDEE